VDQSKDPSFHSWNSPINRISRNASLVSSNLEVDACVMIKGIGTNSTISISNTMKIIARRKKRKENGIRAVFLGSNPHSNGDVFSRSFVERALKIQAAANTSPTRAEPMATNVMDKVINREYIYFPLD